MVIFTSWAQIHRITRLVITTRTTEPLAFVYGNGFNQTKVIIHMNAVNAANQEITNIQSTALLQHSNLLDFVRGDEMVDATNLPPAEGESVWSFSRVDNGFNFEPPTPAGAYVDNPSLPVNVNAAVASFFIMCGPLSPARTRQVAAQVTLTNPTAPISVYQTNLTGTPNFASQVAITALDPIDYSFAQNRRVLQGVGTTERTNIVWQSRTGNNPIVERADGTRIRHYVRITPANGSQFRSVENLSGVITDNNIFREFEYWNGQQVVGFTGLQSQFPVAVMGRGAQFVPYQVNYWYLNPSSTQMSGHYLGQPLTGFNPPACLVFPVLNPDEVIEGNDPGMLVCYKFTVSANNMFPFAWLSAERYGLALRLTDRYGNTGFASLTLDTVDWFDAPRVL